MKRSYLIVTIILAIVALTSCSPAKNELVPGRYAGFKLSDHMDLTTKTEIGGSIMELALESDSLLLEKRFARGTEELSMYIVKFERASQTTGFWYRLIRDVSNSFRATISALPLLYGEFSGETRDGFMRAWFSGRWLYVFFGDSRDAINNAVNAFKDFEKSLVKSIES
jgi:hypothetical protein